MDEEDLDWRAMLVLEEFKGREVLRYCDLPPGVGYKTMADLVQRGMVRVRIDYDGKRIWG